MLPLRTTVLAALSVLVVSLTSTSAAGAAPATFDARDGACTGAEGVTVIVDRNPTSDSDTAADVLMRCVFGAPASGLDALERSGIAYDTRDAFGAPFVCSISALPATCDPFGNGFWSYWHQDGAGWTFHDVGAGDSRPAPGDVDGWRWVGDYNTDPSIAPRVSARAVTITNSPTSPVSSGQNASIGFSIPDAGTTTLCRIDLGTWTSCTTAATHVMHAPTPGTHTITVRATDFKNNVSLASTSFTAIPTPASIVSFSATVDGPHTATVAARIAAGGSTQQVHVEFTDGADGDAVRTASRTVERNETAMLSVPLRSLAANTTFRYRVVTIGTAGTVLGSWSTLTTSAAPLTAYSLTVTSSSSFPLRGTSMRVQVAGLAPDEPVAVRLRTTTLATGTANASGIATVTLRIATAAPLGRSMISAVGSRADRTGRTLVNITRARTLSVTASRRSVPARGYVVVTATGLIPGEPVNVHRNSMNVARGTADQHGRFITRVAVGTRTGRIPLRVTGSHVTRRGDTFVQVTRTIRRR